MVVLVVGGVFVKLNGLINFNLYMFILRFILFIGVQNFGKYGFFGIGKLYSVCDNSLIMLL